MKTLKAAAIILLAIFSSALVATEADAKEETASTIHALDIKDDSSQAVTPDQAEAVTKRFTRFQSDVRNGRYPSAWEFFSKHLQSIQHQNDFNKFKERMSSDSFRTWTLSLQSGTVTRTGKFLTLNTKQGWKLHCIQEDGQWRLFVGQEPDWQARLLPKMRKRTAKHFDIFCFKGSTAEKEIDKIAERRDRGFREICRFLGKDSDVRIRMILFEDAATKYSHTGHQGAGWATGNMVVEIYNEKQKLNPYHETAHILTGPYGSPPALFNEGFATYISERWGSNTLAAMGGGESSIYERVRELNGKGELIPLEELLTYTEIGSGRSNPTVAYPEAASFVKFLIDTYGKDKFLKAYRTLRRSGDKSVQQQNVEALQGIYGKSLDELKNEWKRAFLRLE
jgi:hypothetical protein